MREWQLNSTDYRPFYQQTVTFPFMHHNHHSFTYFKKAVIEADTKIIQLINLWTEALLTKQIKQQLCTIFIWKRKTTWSRSSNVDSGILIGFRTATSSEKFCTEVKCSKHALTYHALKLCLVPLAYLAIICTFLTRRVNSCRWNNNRKWWKDG